MRRILTAIFMLGCGVGGSVDPESVTPVLASTCEPQVRPIVEAGGALGVYAWDFFGGPQAPWTFNAFTGAWSAPSAGGTVDIPNVVAGDRLFLLSHFLVEVADGDGGLRLVVQEWGKVGAPVLGGEVVLKSTAPDWLPVDVMGVWHAETSGPARVVLEGRSEPGARVYVRGAAEMVAVHVRP